MHIPDGFLTNRLALSLDVLSAAAIVCAARRARVDPSGRVVPLMGVLGAFVFVAQMINFPVLGGTSGHLVGGSLLAILLGPMTGFLTMATVVIAQALFLQDGGLVALGANVFNIGAVACFSGYIVFMVLRGGSAQGRRLFWAGFLAGWFSLVASAAFCALQVGISGAIPLRFGLATMIAYHAIVGIVEGALTAGVLGFLLKVRPDLMKANGASRFTLTDWAGAAVFVGVPAAVLILAGGSALPDPLEKLLAASPLLSPGQEPGDLASPERYMDSLIRGTLFVVLISLGFLAGSMSGRRRKQ